MIADRSHLKMAIIMAIGFVGFCAFEGFLTYRVLAEKSLEQEAEREKLEAWRSNFQALKNETKDFKNIFPEIKNIRDLRSLYENLRLNNHGLSSQMDKLQLVKTEEVSQGSTKIGLLKLCVATAGQQEGLVVTASSYGDLVKGIRTLADRKDIVMDQVSIGRSNDGATNKEPMAILNRICLLSRGEV